MTGVCYEMRYSLGEMGMHPDQMFFRKSIKKILMTIGENQGETSLSCTTL